jgi:type I restriction enzyme, R subunit
MPTPGEHKTVQARILAYAQAIGWTFVPRGEAEKRRGFDHAKGTPAEQAAEASPYFDDLVDAQVRKLNPKYADGPGALIGDLRRLHADIAGNRDFLAYLRNTKTFYDKAAGREMNLAVIDYENAEHNVFEVTEEFYCHNGKHGTREDVVFLINGIPVLVIECKNATKDEAIALGVDQVRRVRAVRAADDLHRHRGDRLFLRRHLEPHPPQHLQLEGRTEGEPRSEGQELLRPRARAGPVEGLHPVRGKG